MTPGASVLLGGGAVATLMFVLWLVHFPLRNAAIVDAGWASGIAILAVIYAATIEGGYATRNWLLASMAVIWGARLAGYLFFARVLGQKEEGRYVELRRKWKTNLGTKFLLFFEFQAVLCLVLSIPFLLSMRNPHQGLSMIEIAAAGLWIVAIKGEILADRQLHRFKLDPSSRGKTCRVGLWRYSRHPNYFFEWLIWVSWSIFALAAPWGFLGLISPVLMLFFLFRITGIPATEEQALRTKGDDYRDYQRTTSAFVPWFPKESQ